MISVLTPSIRPKWLTITQESLEAQTYTDFEWITCLGLRNRGFTLPTDYNRMLQQAKGDIIVSLQDCISIPSDALEKIASLDHNGYAYTFPIQREDGSYDWRKYRKEATGDASITPNMWEIDFASAPKRLFQAIGGFDEEFSKGFSWDNVEVGWRAAAAGFKFFLSTDTEGISIDHDAREPHPFRNSLPKNDARANETMRRAERGEYRLNYL